MTRTWIDHLGSTTGVVDGAREDDATLAIDDERSSIMRNRGGANNVVERRGDQQQQAALRDLHLSPITWMKPDEEPSRVFILGDQDFLV